PIPRLRNWGVNFFVHFHGLRSSLALWPNRVILFCLIPNWIRLSYRGAVVLSCTIIWVSKPDVCSGLSSRWHTNKPNIIVQRGTYRRRLFIKSKNGLVALPTFLGITDFYVGVI